MNPQQTILEIHHRSNRDDILRGKLRRAIRPGREKDLFLELLAAFQKTFPQSRVESTRTLVWMAITAKNNQDHHPGLGTALQGSSKCSEAFFKLLSRANPESANRRIRKALETCQGLELNLAGTARLLWYWDTGRAGSWLKVAREYYLS